VLRKLHCEKTQDAGCIEKEADPSSLTETTARNTVTGARANRGVKAPAEVAVEVVVAALLTSRLTSRWNLLAQAAEGFHLVFGVTGGVF